MATRFVATNECDASIEFKKAYVNAKAEDIKIINSPVGMPGRAICNNFIKTCNVIDSPYCITKALINSVKGQTEDGLIFCGSNVSRIKEIVSVKDLMRELVCKL